MRYKFVFYLLFVFIFGCSTAENVKRGGLAPEVPKKFDPKGHIAQSEINPVLDSQLKSDIPSISSLLPLNIEPNMDSLNSRYTVSVINTPVSDILYKLSVDAKRDLVLSNAVQGLVTINAINQPLENILKNISDQVSAYFEISKSEIVVKPNRPFWKSYRVSYVNLKKTSLESMVLNMSIGGVDGSDSSSSSDSSGSTVQVSSEHDFWAALKNNLQVMSQISDTNDSSSASQTPAEQTATSDNGTQDAASSDGETSEDSSFKSVVINKEAGLVSVYTLSDRHKMIREYLDEVLERSNKQVLIEATVVEVELLDEYKAGIDWQAINGNASYGQDVTGTNFAGSSSFKFKISDDFSNLSLTALQTFGDTKVLSSPRIMAVSNQTALLKVVDNEVYFTTEVNRESASTNTAAFTTFETTIHTVPVGFMMSLTPFVTEDNEVSINVRPTLSRIIAYVNDPNPTLAQEGIESKIPVIQEREMSTVLKLRNKQTAVIGGLIQDVHSNDRTGVPGASSIPVFGDLFAYREDTVKKSELVIFIRPIVVDNPDIEHGDLQSLRPFLQTKSTNTDSPDEKSAVESDFEF